MSQDPKDLKRTLLEKYGAACADCGIPLDNGNQLNVSHVVPISLGGTNEEDNLVLLCNSCNAKDSSQPREIEFVDFLAGLLRESPRFSEVRDEEIFGRAQRYRADILATKIEAKERTKLLIECKVSRFASAKGISLVISQLKKYKDAYGECRLVLAIPATLREQEVQALAENGIDLWDLDFIARSFHKELEKASFGYFKALFLTRRQRSSVQTKEEELLKALRECEPGRRDWSVYQSLVGDILELLFCPPLTKPLSEHADHAKANRRDFILPNYAPSGFWSFLREKYMADYLVVDAKNYSRKVKKSEVLQVANYLKPHGAGLFGMILSRRGGDIAGCEHSLREQWLIHRKMILVFDDEDLELMLRAKMDGRSPEDLVGKKVEQFRLSM